jgi:hypothetical protein
MEDLYAENLATVVVDEGKYSAFCANPAPARPTEPITLRDGRHGTALAAIGHSPTASTHTAFGCLRS